MKILVTGFDAFGGEEINPAQLVVEALPNIIDNHTIIKQIIPTIRYESFNVVKKMIDEESPDVIISIGQAGGNTDIAVERVAINCDDFRIPDNQGNQPKDQLIAKEGPAAYFTMLPYREIVNALIANGIPAHVSNSAGTFVCNHIFYAIRHYIVQNNLHILSGFIHIPYIHEQVLEKPNAPSMSSETIAKAIQIAIQTIINEKSLLHKQ